ncbi:uncharacterized protein LOC128876996 isoform X1 [Hylaeus volcanicus]|uniref:uncharacterized protein LOC128876996 isoform X1 n=1 Tax=Hylaeus volcanicus TaxID=313075 RepID=UPI0023B82479|nr:uncharacterized protein LOC128876996 isoform X1 [Hylaeus volcanicus]
MHKCAESANRPPVPPRRKKRKAKFPATVKPPQGTSPTSNQGRGPGKQDRKRLPPPPPPPRAARRIKYHATKDHDEETISNTRPTEDLEETSNSLTFSETEGTSQPTSLQFEDTDLIPTKETSNSSTDKNDNYDPSNSTNSSNDRPYPLFANVPRMETNKYPPLLFTLQDFQNVMSNTLQHKDEPRTTTSVEFVSSIHESFEHSLDDEENDLCFRVTTTNLPFEKCLDRWNATYTGQFIEKFDESSRFIFDDYIDRSNKTNARRSAGPMCYESFEEEPAVPRLTKVRFVIESPSSSTPDYELSEDGDATCDSLQNIEPIVDDEEGYVCTSSVQLTEVTEEVEVSNKQISQNDEFEDAPFNSDLKNRNDALDWPSLKSVLTNVNLGNRRSFIKRDGCVDPSPCSISQNESVNKAGSPGLKNQNDTLDWPSLISVLSSSNLANKGSFKNRDAACVDLNDSPCSTSQNESVNKSDSSGLKNQNDTLDWPSLKNVLSSLSRGSFNKRDGGRVNINDLSCSTSQNEVGSSGSKNYTEIHDWPSLISMLSSANLANTGSFVKSEDARVDLNDSLPSSTSLESQNKSVNDADSSNSSGSKNQSDTLDWPSLKSVLASINLANRGSNVDTPVNLNKIHSASEVDQLKPINDKNSFALENQHDTLDWPSLKSVLSSVKLANRGPLIKSDNTRANLCDSFRSSSSLQSQNESFHSTSAVDMLETVDEVDSPVLNNKDNAIERSSINPPDQGSFIKSDAVRADLSETFRYSTSLESHNESFDSAVAVDRPETDRNLSVSKVECISVSDKTNDGSKEMTESKNLAQTTLQDCIAHAEECQVVEDLPDDFCENENNNIEVNKETTFRSTDEIVDDTQQKLMVNAENANLENEGMVCEQKSTINERKDEVFRRKSITNVAEDKVAKEHLVSNKLGIDIDERVSLVEGRLEGNRKQAIVIDSPKKNSQEYKRKLFVEESLRNILTYNDSSSTDPEEEIQASVVKDSSPDIFNMSLDRVEDAFSQNNYAPQEIFKENISVPVNVRRNSFLENMLSEESNEVWNASTGCKVVGAFPKLSTTHQESIPVKRDEDKLADRLNEAIRMDTDIQEILQDSNEASKKMNPPVPKPRSTVIIQPNRNNAGEAKCNVLNELLSNFSNIKLKPVNSGRQVYSKSLSQVTDDTEKIESMSDSNMESSSKSNLHDEGGNDRNTNLKQKTSTLSSVSEANDNQILAQPSSNRGLKFDKSSELPEKHEERRNSGYSRNAASRSDRVDYPRNYRTKNTGTEEVVKVDVHRSEGPTNDDRSELSMSVPELRVEPSSKGKGNASLERSDGFVERSVESLQMVGCDEKTDARVCEDELDDRGYGENVEADNRGAIERQLDLRRRTGSGDKSAIARRIPRPHCNNNDNNRAVTPVAVSDDQSRDTVTITPGRVRSFVKYYEIRSETTTDKDSRTNDRDRVDADRISGHQSVFSIRRGLEAKAIEARSFDSRRDNFQTSVVDRSAERLTALRTEIKRSPIVEKPEIDGVDSSRSNDAKITEEGGVEEKPTSGSGQKVSERDDSSTQAGKVKRKKSVKFQVGYTVIGTKRPTEDGSVGSGTNRYAKSAGKRKAPGRPTTEGTVFDDKVDSEAIKPEELDADLCSLEKREIAAQIHASADREDCSGINRFVPKPDTPRLVFYCTV